MRGDKDEALLSIALGCFTIALILVYFLLAS